MHIKRIDFGRVALPPGVVRYTIDRSVLRDVFVVTLYWESFEGHSGSGHTLAEAIAEADRLRTLTRSGRAS